MMFKNKVLIFLLLSISLTVQVVSSTGASQMATAFTYQGRLLDTNDPADNIYDMRFMLFGSPDLEDLMDARVINDVQVIDGFFTVELDFPHEVFNGDDRWLEIGVRPGDLNEPNEYTVLNPRQRITPTPYALHALFATHSPGDNLGDHIATQNINLNGNYLSGNGGNEGIYVDNDGFVGISIIEPWSELHVNGTIMATNGTMLPPGPSNGGEAWDVDGVIGTSSNGIGVYGYSISHAGVLGQSDSSIGVHGYSDTGYGILGFSKSSYAGYFDGPKNYFSGSIGIGTDIPTEKLQVDGNIKVTGAGNGLIFPDGTKQTTASGADNLGNHTATQNINLDGHWLSYDGSNKGIYISSLGAVGVGTDSPGWDMEVRGTLVVRDASANGLVFRSGVPGTIASWAGGMVWDNIDLSFGRTIFNSNVGIGVLDSLNYLLEVAGPVNLNKGETGVALRVNGDEALWYDGTEFSWGYGGTWNYFADGVCIGGAAANPTPHKLVVNGTAYKTQGGNTWAVPSDARLKDIHEQYLSGLSEICRLTPVRYSYKRDNELGLSADIEAIGVVAQDVRKVIPEAVEENNDGYLMVNSDPIIWAMLNAIKELKTQKDFEVGRLQKENIAMKEELAEMKRQLADLEMSQSDIRNRLMATEAMASRLAAVKGGR